MNTYLIIKGLLHSKQFTTFFLSRLQLPFLQRKCGTVVCIERFGGVEVV